MIRLSPRAEEAIRRIRVARELPKQVGLKLVKGTRGQLGLTAAAVRPGDLRVGEPEYPLLVVDVELAAEYRGCTLDLKTPHPDDATGPRFVLRDPLADV
jgi:hypothetical protein